MWTLESFFLSLGGYIDAHDLLPILLIVCVLTVTYGWSVLGQWMKLALLFAGGVVLFGSFFEQIIDRYLFPDLHSYVPLIIGSITAGLLELGAVLLSGRIAVIGIFFGAAAVPLFLLAHWGFFRLAEESVIPPLIMIAAISIFNGLAMLETTRTTLFQRLASALGGALGIVYITGLPHGLPYWALAQSHGIKDLIFVIQNHRLPAAICLAISGVAVQSLLHLAARRSQRRKIEHSKYSASRQDRIHGTA